MLNRVFLVGRLSQDPRPSTSTQGLSICNFSIAVDGPTRNMPTSFINCVAFAKSADFINQYIKKGDPLVVEGALQSRSYVNKSGQTVYVTEVVANNVQGLGSRKNDQYNAVNDNVKQNNNFDYNIGSYSNANPNTTYNNSSSNQSSNDDLSDEQSMWMDSLDE
ncbi:hypothetical protein JM47_03075 [Ureaplasma diversum]|uniref:Single-stranded DNA-binding protein n=1 Tax=Ureaplasma diversum TaxID=42094 RepID=A0A0C5S293_9BACT|nr:single-stranded DNA-binding protein [Ureaplasma diversum]AJQ45525.1 hypothetical protein JM47_03075 [Ureaplasma diversum]